MCLLACRSSFEKHVIGSIGSAIRYTVALLLYLCTQDINNTHLAGDDVHAHVI